MGQGSNLGIQGDRIQTAHTEANTLLNEALNMMAKMAGKDYLHDNSQNQKWLHNSYRHCLGISYRIADFKNNIKHKGPFWILVISYIILQSFMHNNFI